MKAERKPQQVSDQTTAGPSLRLVHGNTEGQEEREAGVLEVQPGGGPIAQNASHEAVCDSIDEVRDGRRRNTIERSDSFLKNVAAVMRERRIARVKDHR